MVGSLAAALEPDDPFGPVRLAWCRREPTLEQQTVRLVEEGHARVAVVDNGFGISPEDQELWDIFVERNLTPEERALVDAAMSGRSAPRVWAVMESPGSGPGGAAAGLVVGLEQGQPARERTIRSRP